MENYFFYVKIFDWNYLHLTAQTKETYFRIVLKFLYFFQGLYGAQVAALTSKTSVASNDNCGDAAEGYYEEYVTGDTRYIVMFVFVC